jgi:hypothetical protein
LPAPGAPLTQTARRPAAAAASMAAISAARPVNPPGRDGSELGGSPRSARAAS